jgi:DNA-binding winged helix-turn-helix (wHTH) protein
MVGSDNGRQRSRRSFTPIEARIIQVLSDGMAHTRQELHQCLDDDLSRLSSIQFHISNIRRKLRGRGEDVVCVLDGTIKYRHIRLIRSSNDGRV